MKYIKGSFKYQLSEGEQYQTSIKGFFVNTRYYSLDKDGVLTAKVGFAWDGCSGSFDTDTNMIGGRNHDIFCLMVARGELPRELMPQINKDFYETLLRNKMHRWRAWWHYKAVEWHFAGNRKPSRRKVYYLKTF